MKIHIRIDQDAKFFFMLIYNKRQKGTTKYD